MANTNIQGVIQLEGPGHVAKREGNYRPGEFKQLVNCELQDGIIRQRRNVLATGEYAAIGSTIPNPESFVGNLDTWSVVTSKTKQRAVSWDTDWELWAPTSLPVNGTAGSFHKIVGVFEFNDKYYWLTHEFNASSTTHTYSLYHASSVGKIPSDITFGGLTKVVLVTKTGNGTKFTDFQVHSMFIHKDRLWFSVGDTLYFSKATDPTVMTVPYGGNFRIPHERVNHAFAHRDSIYILTETGVYSMTYSINVNEDGYLRPLTQTMGAEWGVVHDATPYIINRHGIYVITGVSVDKVYDTNNLDTVANYTHSKIVSFSKYLVVIRRDVARYTTYVGSHDGWWWDKDARPWWESNGLHMFLINTDNGATHAMDFQDQHDGIPSLHKPGFIIDAIFNPEPDNDGNSWLYFLTNAKNFSQYTFKGNTYGMNEHVDTDVYDEVRNTAGTKARQRARYAVEIDSYVPDGNEYLWQKFRTLQIMGVFPYTDFTVTWRMDNVASYRTAEQIKDLTSNESPHNPHRFPLNQRGRSISILLQTDPGTDYTNFSNPSGDVYYPWQISDIRVYWTYTNRNTERRYIVPA